MSLRQQSENFTAWCALDREGQFLDNVALEVLKLRISRLEDSLSEAMMAIASDERLRLRAQALTEECYTVAEAMLEQAKKRSHK